MFYKRSSHTLIIRGHNIHMPPMTSNNGGRVDNWEASKVDNKGFHMPPLSRYTHIISIYTISLEYGLTRPF